MNGLKGMGWRHKEKSDDMFGSAASYFSVMAASEERTP